MKTLRLFGLFCLFAVMILGTAGCSDDDEELGSSIVGKHSKKCTFYTLRFGCSFAAVNTIKPQLL